MVVFRDRIGSIECCSFSGSINKPYNWCVHSLSLCGRSGFRNNSKYLLHENPGPRSMGGIVSDGCICIRHNNFTFKKFKITLIHSNWEKYKGKSPAKRIIWSFIGGFILIIGARMAGGCTSGHVLSGGMQLAVSSLVFAAFVFGGLLITGKYFYKSGKS